MTNPKTPAAVTPGTVRRKADFLPTVFVSSAFDEAFLPRLVHCFRAVIERANGEGDKAWAALIDTFEKHGLMELKVPQELILNPMEFSYTTRDGETHSVSYKSDKPMAYGFEHVNLKIERERIDDAAYLAEVSAISAYLFAWRLFRKPLEAQDIALTRVDATALSDYLRLHHRGEVSAESLTKFLISRVIEEHIDDLPGFEAFDNIGKLVMARLEERFASVLPSIEARASQQAAIAKEELKGLSGK